jgi:hypothetical protein
MKILLGMCGLSDATYAAKKECVKEEARELKDWPLVLQVLKELKEQ